MRPNQLQENVATLQFLIEFAQLDLLVLTPAEFLGMMKKANTFLHRDKPKAWKEDAPINGGPILEFLQQRTRELLVDVAAHTGFTLGATDLILSFWGVTDGRRFRIVPRGNPDAVWLYQVVRLFEAIGTERIQMCPATDCGRVFLKVTKKEFCSTRCQSRTYMRKRRAEERAKDNRFTSMRQGLRRGKTTRKK